MTETLTPRIGPYEVVRKLKDDGRVLLFEAHCSRTARRVWLRVLTAADRDAFHREARALLGLVHPNVIGVIDYSGRDAKEPFLATEHLQGRDLKTLVGERGAIEAKAAAAIAAQIADGLVATHREGLVHGAVSPANVFVTDDGRVVLTGLDGAAQATDAARRADFAALGTTLLFALLGGDVSSSDTGDAKDASLVALATKLGEESEPVRALRAKAGGDAQATVARFLDPNAAPPAARTGVINAGDARNTFLAATKGRYELKDAIGEGGMGKVYRALDRKLQRDVAVKMILGAVDDALRRRFHREARAMGKVRHPNVLEVLDYSGPDAEMPYLVLEYVDGRTLSSLLPRVAESEATALCVALEVARALEAVHTEGFVHRDVKPDNIFLDRIGRVLLADFGIVRSAAGTGEAGQTFSAIGSKFANGTASIGSPHYASPEQLFDPDSAKASSDLFSLGSLLIATLTGLSPIDAQTVPECLARLERGEFRAVPRASAEVRELIAALHAKDPKKRPASAAAVCEKLEAMLTQRKVVDTKRELRKLFESGANTTMPAVDPAATVRMDRMLADDRATARLAAPKPWRVLIAAGVIAALAIGGALVWRFRPQPPPIVAPLDPPPLPADAPLPPPK